MGPSVTMSPAPESKISRERLNQIALRKLQSFAITPQLEPTQQALVGEWRFRTGKIVAPGTQVRIPGSHFRVEGHDHVKFLDAPLSALEPLQFYDAESAEAFEARIARALAVRLGFLQSLAGQLNARKVSPRLDGNALVLRGEVDTTEHIFELLADPNGVRMVSIRSKLTQNPPMGIHLPVQLEEHPTRADLELFLSGVAHRGELTAASARPAAAPPARAVLQTVTAPAGSLTVSLLQRLGPDVVLGGHNGRLELSQELKLGGATYRFQAFHVSGTTFQARLVSGTTEKWADKFDLTRFPGVEELARVCLGVPKEAPLEPRSSAEAHDAAPEQPQGAGYLTPQPGEVWVMMVLVEREAEGEIRYTCADVDGKPYGATRLLRAEDFKATFSAHGPGWRLRIVVDRVEGGAVVYRQLNAKNERGPEKRIPLATLSTIFVPEAQAY